MNRENVIRMAREAGIDANESPKAKKALGHSVPLSWLERFAALVAAAEREACASVAELTPCLTTTPERIATAIRARSKP